MAKAKPALKTPTITKIKVREVQTIPLKGGLFLRPLGPGVSGTWEVTNNVLNVKWGANTDTFDTFTLDRMEGKCVSGKLVLTRIKP